MRPCTLWGHPAQGAISVYCTARRARWNSCRTLQGSAIFRWTADMMIGGDDLITDDSIIVDGNAKINLTLDILGKRPDGYHEVAMVMQSIGLHDTVKLSKIPRGIELVLDVPGLEADEQNLAWRAAKKLRAVCALSSRSASRLRQALQAAARMQLLCCAASMHSIISA